MNHRVTAAVAVFFLLGLAGAVPRQVSAEDVGQSIASHPMIGEQAPGFDLEKVDGGTLSLESLKGRYVVLHFGASW